MTLVSILLTIAFAAVAEPSTDSEDLIRDYLSKTLRAERFENAYRLGFRVEWNWPNSHPEHPGEHAYDDIVQMALPPQHKSFARIFHDLKRSGSTETHTSIWNGSGEVNKYQLDKRGMPSATISYEVPATDLAVRNKYLESLGLARSIRQRAESSEADKFWFLAGAPVTAKGKLRSEVEVLDGVPCKVLECGKHDLLWFSNDDGPRRLMKRDFWLVEDNITHRIQVFSEFSDDGLPFQITTTIHMPVDIVGHDSDVDLTETITLKELSFEAPPANEFEVDLSDPGTVVRNLRTGSTYTVQVPDSKPFEGQLKLSTGTPKIRKSTRESLIYANILVVGIIAAVTLFRRLKATDV